MKRFMAAAAAFLSLAALVTPALASNERVAAHQNPPSDIAFRTHSAAFVVGTNRAKLDEAGLLSIDSLTFTKQGAAVADTTAPIALFLSPPKSGAGITALTDSLGVYGRFFLIPQGGNGAVDTVYIQTQLSPDAVNWTSQDSPVNTKGVACTDLTTGAGTAAPFFSILIRNSAVGIGGENFLRNDTLYPFIRFIVRDKVASTTVVHNFAAKWVDVGSGVETNN